MKINDNFVLREIYNTYLLVPVMSNNICNEIISFNKTGAVILKEAAGAADKIDLAVRTNSVLNPNRESDIEKQIVMFISKLIDMGLIVEG